MMGTTPPGTTSEEQAARWVREMFAGVAPRYDFLNHVLSLNIDRAWRKALLRALQPLLEQPSTRVLDLCCGTGDVLLDLQKTAPAATILGADFCHPMLVTAGRKSRASGRNARLFEADALLLPVADNTFDAVAISFGFRNLANYSAGFSELYRVLKPRGVLAVLEFSQPQGMLMRTAYSAYSKALLPLIGSLISGSRQAYTYLPDSIRKFPSAANLRGMMDQAGFVSTRYELLTGGVAALHVGTKG